MEPEKRNAIESVRAALVLIATLGTISFNGIAAAGLINGVTPAEISDRYPTVITPAGYAFSIWSLIYIGLVVFSIYQLLPAKILRFSAVRSLYIFSCLLNCAWIYFWHHGQIAVCFLIIMALAAVLVLINNRIRETQSWIESAAVRAPFGIYLGWVTAATVLNFAILLAYLGFGPEGYAGSIGSALLLLAIGFAVIYRVALTNYFAPLSIAWALTAIAVEQSGNTLVVSTAALGVVTCLIASLSFVMNLKSSQNE